MMGQTSSDCNGPHRMERGKRFNSFYACPRSISLISSSDFRRGPFHLFWTHYMAAPIFLTLTIMNGPMTILLGFLGCFKKFKSVLSFLFLLYMGSIGY